MNLREIQALQNQRDDEIRYVANSIDPKLMGYLNYQDLFDDKYMDNALMSEYTEKLSTLVHQANLKIQVETEQYLVNFINDMSTVLDNTGYLTSTGEETHSFLNFDSIPESYVPSVEIESVWTAVHELRHKYKYSPFWKKHGYTLYGNGETVCVVPASTPQEFIQLNRAQFTKSFGDTNLGKMERAARIKETKFDYPIYVPALSPYEERNIPSSYEEAIRRHLILKEAMEGTLSDEHIAYRSIIDAEGNVTLEPLGYF